MAELSRREWVERALNNALRRYLGPTGIPDRVNVLNEVFNPVVGVEQAGSAARTVANPNASMTDRIGATGRMATEIAGVVAPAAAVRMAGLGADDAARAVEEGLTGISATPSAVAGRDFAMDEAGAIRAWHGSPHDFDKFSLDKIGTGEGAQAYGHGLYFAENRAVGEGYQQALAPMTQEPFRKIGFSEQEAREAASFAKTTISGEPRLAAESFAVWKGKSVTPEMVQAFDDAMKTKGRLYEVEIDANPDDFLDWDAPITETPEAFQEWAKARMDEVVLPEGSRRQRQMQNWRRAPGDWVAGPDVNVPPPRVAEVRGWLGNYGEDQVPMTDALREAGIPGIRYLDQGSRGAMGGTRNYVVFDENLVSIIKKYGIAGAAAMLGMSTEDLQAQAQQQNALRTSVGPIPRAD